MDLNSTILMLTPVVESVDWIVGTLKIILGGMFGLYLIMVVLRWKEFRELKRLNAQTQEMHQDIQKMQKEILSLLQKHKK